MKRSVTRLVSMVLLLALLTHIVTPACNVFGPGRLTASGRLIGIVVGYAAALIMGNVVSFADLQAASWFALPRPFYFGLEFHPDAIVMMILMYMVQAVQTIGDVSSTAMGGFGRESTDTELGGAIKGQGICGMIGACIGGLPTDPYSQNVGLICTTKVVARRVFTMVGVITTSDRAAPLLRDLKKDWAKKLNGVVLLDAAAPGGKVEGIPVAAVYEGALDWLRREPLDEVYVSVPYQSGDSLRPLLNEMESMGLCVHLNVTVLEPYTAAADDADGAWFPRLHTQVETAGGVPFVTISAADHDFGAMMIKRLMDVVGALVGLVLSVPIIAVTAIPLKLESPGPLFFKQKRVGRNGRPFYIYKLRSMYTDAEQRKQELMAQNKMQGLMFKMDDDPRVTKVGKFIRRTSIDELPQFWNVLRGDMSLVGTRPPTVDEYEQYDSHHKRRLSMKPGITGLWQVSGRSDIQDFEEVVKLDVTYIDHWSLALDLRILAKTVAVVLRRTGAE